MQEKKLFLFDVDGTLYQAHYIVPLIRALQEKKLITKEQEDAILFERQKYNEHKISYAEVLDKVFNLYASYLKTISIEEIQGIAKEIVIATQEKMDSYATNIIQEVKENHYAIALSLSPREVINAFQEIMHCTESYGCPYAIENGKYTGKSQWPILETKDHLIVEIQKQFPDVNNAILVGDTIEDFKTAKKHGFQFYGVHADYELQEVAEQGKVKVFKDLKALSDYWKEIALI